MKNIYSTIKKAKKYLINNDIIAIPPETVYGLAGNAYSNKSVKKIFFIKKRPFFNPLIICYVRINDLKKDCYLNDNFKKLYKKFCPGPLTYVLNKKKNSKKKKIGIVFGPESSGLSNDEINSADYLVKIPTNNKFSSLNLSHSAIIFCFELFKIFSNKKNIFSSSYKSSLATKSEVNKFLSFIVKNLDKKGFLQPDHKRKSMIRNINNIFHRLNLSEQEIRILLGIFSTLNEFNKKSGIDKRLSLFINHVV